MWSVTTDDIVVNKEGMANDWSIYTCGCKAMEADSQQKAAEAFGSKEIHQQDKALRRRHLGARRNSLEAAEPGIQRHSEPERGR